MSSIGIVCAMREEVQKIIDALALTPSEDLLGCRTYQNQEVVLIESSIGKVASALATQALIQQYQVKKIINIGLAGALKPIQSQQAYFIRSVTQHDAFIPFDHYQRDMYQHINCQVPSDTATALKLTTGDQFITDTAQVDSDAELVDMEGFAVAYTAQKYQLPVVLIKAVSDEANGQSEQDLFANLNQAMDQTIVLLRTTLAL